MNPSSGEFSVCQFFDANDYEYICRFVSAEEAVFVFKHYTNNIASHIRVIERVSITDGGDCINMEWQKGKGIVFPVREEKSEPNMGS